MYPNYAKELLLESGERARDENAFRVQQQMELSGNPAHDLGGLSK